jgi:hypothetical protein
MAYFPSSINYASRYRLECTMNVVIGNIISLTITNSYVPDFGATRA